MYADFASAECYALNELMIELGASATVTWKGVELDPGQPVPMRMLARRALDQLEDEIADIRQRWPGVNIAVPKGKPRTVRAIVAVASVHRLHPARAADYRDAIYRAFWRDGADISSVVELQRVADSVGVPRFVELDDPDAEETAANWEIDWAMERLGGVPRVIRSDGRILWGLRQATEVADFFSVR